MKGFSMRGFLAHRLSAVAALALLVAATGAAGELHSSMRNVSSGVYESQGYRLEPAYDVKIPPTSRDLAPPQVFELIRPDNRSVTIGRMFTSCSCIQLETPKRTFEAGERILFYLHNVRATPLNGQVYAIFVQIGGPIRATLRIDTFVQSGFAPVAADTTAQPDAGAATSPNAPAVQVPGVNDDLATLLRSVDARGEGTGDLALDVIGAEIAALDDALDIPVDGEESQAAAPDAAGDGPESEPDSGTASLLDDAQTDVASARQALDSYFQDDPDAANETGGERPDAVAPLSDAPPAAVPAASAAPAAPAPELAPNAGAPAIPFQGAVSASPAIADMAELPPEVRMQLARLQAQLEAETGQPVIVAPVQVAPVQVLTPPAQPPVETRPVVREPEGALRPAPAERAFEPVQAVTLITVGVRDMSASMRFYEELGWRRAARGKYDQTAFFQLNGQVLALYPMRDLLREQNMEDALPAPGGITLALHMRDKADVWEMYRRFIAAGGTTLRAPAEMANGAVSAYVADPDGNPWEISWVPQFRIDENGGLWLP